MCFKPVQRCTWWCNFTVVNGKLIKLSAYLDRTRGFWWTSKYWRQWYISKTRSFKTVLNNENIKTVPDRACVDLYVCKISDMNSKNRSSSRSTLSNFHPLLCKIVKYKYNISLTLKIFLYHHLVASQTWLHSLRSINRFENNYFWQSVN